MTSTTATLTAADLRAAKEEKARRLTETNTLAFLDYHRPHVVHPTRGDVLFDAWDYEADYIGALDAGGPVVELKARQIGISTCTMLQKTRRLLVPHTHTLVVSRKEDLGKELLAIAGHAIETCERPFPVECEVKTTEIRCANGSRITVETAAQNTGRGFSGSDVVLDEMAFLPWADRIYRNLRPVVSRSGNIAVISTPDLDGDRFSQIYTRARAEGSGWAYFRHPWQVCPEYDEAWAEAERRDYTEAEWASEFCCEFGSTAEAVFSRATLERAIALAAARKPMPGGTHAFGADVAGEGRDDSVLLVLDTTEEPWLPVAVAAHGVLPAAELQKRIEAISNHYKVPVWIDQTGLGWAVRGNLACESVGVVFTGGQGEPAQDGDTWRVPRGKLIGKLILALEQGRLALPEDYQALLLGLRSYRWDKRKGANADYVDALALAVWAAEEGGAGDGDAFYI